MNKLSALFILTIITLTCADVTKPLYLREYWGVARNQDFVTGGIPIPKGMVNDADHVSLYSPQGAPVPYQSRPLMRWPDGSLRWLLLTFPADMAAQNTTEYQVRFHRDGTAGQAGYGHSVSVTGNATHVIVNTGPMQFKVRKGGGFNLFDQVVIGGDEILSANMANGATISDHFGGTYTSSNDPAHSVKIEEGGPLRAVIRIEGNHSNGTDDHRFYGYLCRIYAYAGKSYVDVQYSVKNSYFTPRGALAFTGMALKLKANLSGAQTATWFSNVLGSAALSDTAYVYEPFQYGFEVKANGSVQHAINRSSTDRALGWIDLSDGKWGIAAGIYEFASNCPNEVTAIPGGGIETRLWPYRYEQGSDSASYGDPSKCWDTDRYYIGMAEHKTHKVRFYFHSGSTAAASVENVMAAFNHPVIPQTSRDWLVLSRAVPGEIYPASTPVPDPASFTLPMVNKPLEDPLYTLGKGQYYQDNWVDFGEAYWRNETGDTEIYENQGTRYFRYMSPTVFRLLEANAWIYADFRRTHVDSYVVYDPDLRPHKWLYAAEIVRDPVHSEPLPDHGHIGYFHKWIPPQPGHRLEHYSNRDLFTYYLLSGDLKIRDGLYEFTEFMNMGRAWRTSTDYLKEGDASRSTATAWSSMWMAAMVENDDTIKGINIQQYFTNYLRGFSQGIPGKNGVIQTMEVAGCWNLHVCYDNSSVIAPKVWIEAMLDMPFCWYMEYFWHDSMQTYLDNHVRMWRDDLIGTNGGVTTECGSIGWAPTGSADNPAAINVSKFRLPGPLALLYYHSGDPGLLHKIDLLCMNGEQPNIFQGDHSYFAKYDMTYSQAYMFSRKYRDQFRTNPIITWDYDPTPSIGKESSKNRTGMNAFSMYPNPANTAAIIAFSLDRPAPVTLCIYNPQGRLIRTLMSDKSHQAGNYRAAFSAMGLASGLYVARLTTTRGSFSKKFILMK